MNNTTKIKVGDYIISQTMQIFRIIDIYDDSRHVLYDIKGINSIKNDYDDETTVPYFKCLTIDDIYAFGRIIPEENTNNLMSILYDKSNTYK